MGKYVEKWLSSVDEGLIKLLTGVVSFLPLANNVHDFDHTLRGGGSRSWWPRSSA